MLGRKKAAGTPLVGTLPSEDPIQPDPAPGSIEEYAQQTAEILETLSKDTGDRWGLTINAGGRRRIYNPSQLVGRKGLAIYDEMLRDGQVKNSYFLRRLCLLATARTVVPADEEDPEAVEQKEFIDYVFKAMTGSVEDFILKISDAIRCGFKVAEKNYRYIEEGPFKGKVGIDHFKVRNSINYEFETDPHGNLLPDGLIELGSSSGEDTRLPIDKFVIWTYGSLDDDGTSWYGRSEFEAAYRYYFGNDIIHRIWAAMVERYVKPLVIASEQESSLKTNKAKIQKLLTDIKNLHRKVGLWVPAWAKVEVKDPPDAKTGKAKDFLEFNNQMISKSLLLGTLIQQEGKSGGSYALGRKQFDLFFLNNAQIMRQLEQDVFLEQIIKDLIDKNYPKPKYPEFKLVEPQSPEEMKAKVGVVEILAKVPGIELDPELIREYVGLKRGFITKPEAPPAPPPAPPNPPAPPPAAPQPPASPPPPATPKEPASGDKEYAELFRAPLRQERFVDYSEVARVLDQLPNTAAGQMTAAYDKTVKSIIKQAEKKGLLTGEKDYSVIPKIQINAGEFKKVYTELIIRAYMEGARSAAGEVERYREEKGQDKTAEFAMPAYDPVGVAGTFKELDVLPWLAPFTQEEIDAVASRLNHEAFVAAGAEGNLFQSAARLKMTEAIDQGWSMQRFTDEINALGLSKADRAALETGFLTETNRVYNQARWEVYQKTDDVTGIIYSAILDHRTTQLCRDLDGRMWKKDDANAYAYNPPNHFRCRSILEAVFKGEEPPEWDDITQMKNEGLPEPAEGFGGPAGSRVKPARSVEHPGYTLPEAPITPTPSPAPASPTPPPSPDALYQAGKVPMTEEEIQNLKTLIEKDGQLDDIPYIKGQKHKEILQEFTETAHHYIGNPANITWKDLSKGTQRDLWDNILARESTHNRVYRGMNFFPEMKKDMMYWDDFQRHLGKAKKGDVVTFGDLKLQDQILQSTSYKRSVAKQFSYWNEPDAHSVILDIKAKAGQKIRGLDVSKTTPGIDMKEAEIIIGDATKYRVVDVVKESTGAPGAREFVEKITIHLEQL